MLNSKIIQYPIFYIISGKAMDLDFDKTFHLQIAIGNIIDDTLYNWDNSRSRLTKESFKRKKIIALS